MLTSLQEQWLLRNSRTPLILFIQIAFMQVLSPYKETKRGYTFAFPTLTSWNFWSENRHCDLYFDLLQIMNFLILDNKFKTFHYSRNIFIQYVYIYYMYMYMYIYIIVNFYIYLSCNQTQAWNTFCNTLNAQYHYYYYVTPFLTRYLHCFFVALFKGVSVCLGCLYSVVFFTLQLLGVCVHACVCLYGQTGELFPHLLVFCIFANHICIFACSK